MNELEKKTIGELIGLINGIYSKGIEQIRDNIYRIFDLLIEGNPKQAYDLVKDTKQHYLSSCMSCISPCGNSGFYKISESKQIERYLSLKKQYSKDMDYMTLCQKIVEIGEI